MPGFLPCCLQLCSQCLQLHHPLLQCAYLVMQLVDLFPVQLCELMVAALQPVVLGFIGSYRLLCSMSTNRGGSND